MAKRKHPDIGYLAATIGDTGTVSIVAGSAKLEEKDVPHSFLAFYKEKKWKVYQEEFYVCSLAVGHGSVARTLLMLGMHGEAVISDPNTAHREMLAKGKDAPNKLRTMHQARYIGSHFYAVGMRRQVFRRHVQRGPWSRIDAGVFVPDTSKEIAGFLSVDGFDDNEVYAVGYGGQIWLYDGKSWALQPSPTNARLECVRCQKDGTVLISGEGGLVLRGRRDVWKDLQQDVTEEPLLSLASLGGKTYFADEMGVIVEYDGKKFAAMKLPKGGITTGILEANAQLLLSVGEEDICVFDGKSWSAIAHPPIDPD